MRVERLKHREQGQTLVMFVFAIVGLLAMVGLAIDGGTVFVERRRMQNAADAGSLAGVRKLSEIMCDRDISPKDADAAIWAEVEQYARQNGVREGVGSTVAEYMRFDGSPEVVPYEPSIYVGNAFDGGDGVPMGASGISTTATMTHTTYFVSLVGVDTTTASAPAVAVTGPPAAALRPFGVPVELVQDLDDHGEFSVSFSNSGGETTWLTKTAEHRGWMNLAYVWNAEEADNGFPRALDESADAKELKEWMENGWDIELSADCEWFGEYSCRRGDFVHAKPGANASAVCEAPYFPTTITVPVYDYIPMCATEVPGPRPACPTQGSGYVYHIVGFTAIDIMDCSQGGKVIHAELRELKTGLNELSWDMGYMEGVCAAQTLKAITLRE